MNKDTNYNSKDALQSMQDVLDTYIAELKQQIRVTAFVDCTKYLADLIEPKLNSNSMTDAEKLESIRRILLIQRVSPENGVST